MVSCCVEQMKQAARMVSCCLEEEMKQAVNGFLLFRGGDAASCEWFLVV